MKIYAINDAVCNADVFVFIEKDNGAALHYFKNYCSMRNDFDLKLYQIAEIVVYENEYIVEPERLFIVDSAKLVKEEFAND